MTGLWTRRDAAHQNAVDTCTEEGLRSGTDKFEDKYREMYRLTLLMLLDDSSQGDEYTPECIECERLPYTRRCMAHT
jgi:hypothetical protein